MFVKNSISSPDLFLLSCMVPLGCFWQNKGSLNLFMNSFCLYPVSILKGYLQGNCFFISLAVEAFVHYELEWSSLVLLCYCLLECVITEYLLCYITIVLLTCQPSTNCYQTGNNGVDYLCLYFCMLKKINIFGELNCRKK